MIVYQVENLTQVKEEITPLLQQHYMEIANHQAIRPLAIDWEGYEKLDSMGWLRVLTARDHPVVDNAESPAEVRAAGPGRLIGYFVSFLTPNLHYSTTSHAMNDIFYVMPEYRKGSIGYRLVREAIADLKRLDCHILTVHMKTAYPFRQLLERQGFHLTEENWEKVL